MDDLFDSSFSSKKRFRTAIWTVKLAFLSIGIISSALLLKLAIPYSLNLLLSTLPRIWFSFRSWLTPPYLYILVNFIIVGIAVSSRFQQRPSEKKTSNEEDSEVENTARQHKQTDATDPSTSQKPSLGLWPGNDDVVSDVGDKLVMLAGRSSEFSAETWSESSCLTTESDNSPEVNRPVSARSGSRKPWETYRGAVKSTASSSEKGAEPLGVAKPKKHNDTLDTTWKAITEGVNPPTRQLKKSDTWDTPPRMSEPEPEPGLARRELKKSETFNDTASSTSSGSASSRGSGGMRRELVLSQDELNRRVEAFIKKVNDEMRLQRQESDKRYLEMVNRAVY